MDYLKNKQAAKNRQKDIKKAAALRAQVGGCRSCPLMHLRKGSTRLSFSHRGKVSLAPPSVRKLARSLLASLILALGKVLWPSKAPSPFLLFLYWWRIMSTQWTLLVPLDTTRSIVQDVDLDEYSKHETNLLGDFGLFDMMRVCCTIVALSLLTLIFPWSLLT